MKRIMIKQTKDRSAVVGQAMVEFTLTIVLLLFILFGLIEVARWFYALNAIQNAAQEATRYASTGQPSRNQCVNMGYSGADTNPNIHRTCRLEAIEQFARDRAMTGLDINEAETNPDKAGYFAVDVRGRETLGSTPVDDEPGSPRSKVEVVITYNHPVSNPLISNIWGTIRVQGAYQMVNEPWSGGDPEFPEEFSTRTPMPLLDGDGDGWSDIHERDTSNTSPTTVDTDGDGYCEGVEANWSQEVIDRCGSDWDGSPLNPCEPDENSPTCEAGGSGIED